MSWRSWVPKPLRQTARTLIEEAQFVADNWPVDRSSPRVFYGHPGGDLGGPLVKIKRLAEHFPNHERGFNLVYSVNGQLPGYKDCRRARRLGIPLVYNANGLFYEAWYGPGWQEQNARTARVYRLASYVFFQSEFSLLSARIFLGEAPCEYEILYNAVDTRHFAPTQPRSAGSGPALLCTGFHRERYRLILALQVLKQVLETYPQARLLLAGAIRGTPGASDLGDEVLRTIEELGLTQFVTLLPPYTQETAPQVYQMADLLLHTQENDVCPNVVLEALACGLPVIYSRSGGTPELVGTDAGIGVESHSTWERIQPGPVESWAKAVQDVVGNRDRFAYAARARAVRRFDRAHWLKRHQAVFDQLLTGSQQNAT